MPKLSIITINLNNASGLKKTIESVVCQTFDDYEYIIIDGGSNDGSIGVIKEFADRITYWVSESDKGIYNAMNKGILKATGEYLLFLNSGDWLVDQDVLSKVFSQGSEANILYGDIIFWHGKQKQKLWSLKNQVIDLQYMYKFTIPHPAAFIKRNLFDNELYDERYTIVSDWKFFVQKIVLENASLHYLDQTVAYVNTFGLSFNKNNQELTAKERADVLQELFQPLILSNIEECYRLKNTSPIKYLIEDNNNRIFKQIILLLIKTVIRIEKWRIK